MKADFEAMAIDLPVNGNEGRLWARDLDCAVVEAVHDLRAKAGLPSYDTVRSAFQEGKEVYLERSSGRSTTSKLPCATRHASRATFFPRNS